MAAASWRASACSSIARLTLSFRSVNSQRAFRARRRHVAEQLREFWHILHLTACVLCLLDRQNL
jgi:hypothetical protein